MESSAATIGPGRIAMPAVWAGWPIAAAAATVFAVPAILFARLVLYHFYVTGAFLLDSGLLASLIWHNPSLTQPASTGGGPFLTDHVSPVLMAVSALSQILPLSMTETFAWFTGTAHGLLGLGCFWLLVSGHGMRRGAPLCLATAAAIGFACGGQAIAIARYPHFELFGAACLLLTLVALALDRIGFAVCALLAALLTREDMGLHAFGFLASWSVANALRGRPWRSQAVFAMAGFLWSAAELTVQHRLFPGPSAFVRVYLGYPPLAHVTPDLVATRLLGWLWWHAAILLPLLAVLAVAIRRRSIVPMIGYLACLPWSGVHLLAFAPLAGMLAGYYAFPFVIALVWPFLDLPERGEPRPSLLASPAAAILGLAALSLLPLGVDYDPGRIPVPRAFWDAPPREQRARMDRSIAAIAAARADLGRLIVDNSAAALAPQDFARGEIASEAGEPADTAVYLEGGYDAARLRGAPARPIHYGLEGTPLRIDTARPSPVLEAMGFRRVLVRWANPAG